MELRKAARDLPPRLTIERPTPFDPTLVKDAWFLTVGAIGRHRAILLAAMLGGLACGGALTWALPRSYHAECRLLAQRNLIMPALGNPRRAVPIDSDNPTRGVAETVLARDNLIDVIKHTGLRERWYAERAPLQRLKDFVWGALRRPLNESQRLEALIGVLEKRLTVATDENSITLAIDWPNAATGADLLRVTEDNFLETRHNLEVSKIGETIQILEGHAADIRATIDATFLQIEGPSSGEGPRAPHGPRASSMARSGSVDSQEQLLEWIHKREFASAPADDPPLSEFEKERIATKALDSDVPDEKSDDKRTDYPRARLKVAFDNYDDLERRLDAARIELDTAQAAFKYRYRVIQPVVVPEKPVSPKPALLLATGAGLGFLLGLFVALGLDLRGEVIQSAWQLEQRLKIPVLAELRDE
jgi:hypothetical protein